MRLILLLFAALIMSACAVRSKFVEQAQLDPTRPVAVVEHGSTFPNAVGGVSYAFGFVNTSNKTIKYLEADAVPYNRVGDQVTERLRGRSRAIMKDIGPYPPGASNITGMPGMGAPRFGVVWYQGDVACAALVSIRIEFMDGEKISLEGDELRRVIERPGCAHAIHGVIFPEK